VVSGERPMLLRLVTESTEEKSRHVLQASAKRTYCPSVVLAVFERWIPLYGRRYEDTEDNGDRIPHTERLEYVGEEGGQ